MKRVFQIDRSQCEQRPASGIPQHHGGKLKRIACIEFAITAVSAVIWISIYRMKLGPTAGAAK